MLLMPDHLHLVVTPYLGYDITSLITGWKRFLTRSYRLKFQRNFLSIGFGTAKTLARIASMCASIQYAPDWSFDQRIGRGFIPGLLGRQMSRYGDCVLRLGRGQCFDPV